MHLASFLVKVTTELENLDPGDGIAKIQFLTKYNFEPNSNKNMGDRSIANFLGMS